MSIDLISAFALPPFQSHSLSLFPFLPDKTGSRPFSLFSDLYLSATIHKGVNIKLSEDFNWASGEFIRCSSSSSSSPYPPIITSKSTERSRQVQGRPSSRGAETRREGAAAAAAAAMAVNVMRVTAAPPSRSNASLLLEKNYLVGVGERKN